MEEKSIWTQIKSFIKERFDLESDQASHEEVVETIKRGIDFKGTNLWILIFAVVVASVGLNVNSTAVIIGAMLISPLMGPIMGIGLSLGVNDFDLLKRSFRSFAFAVGVSIVASTLYFLITPLSLAQSELLARTTPTIWDVLIATFGGLAGVVAQTRKDRTTPVIPGVAIATALMPPLCTAGFGIATGNLSYFGGAFYLFLINTVFIAFATYFMIRFMKFEKKVHLDQKKTTKVKRTVIFIITLTIVPSVILAYGMVQKSVFENSANNFVKTSMQYPSSHIVGVEVKWDRKNGNSINVTIVGQSLSDDMISIAKSQMPNYGLRDVQLNVRQAAISDPVKVDNVAIQQLMASSNDILNDKNEIIAKLESEIAKFKSDSLPIVDIASEMGLIETDVLEVTMGKTERVGVESGAVEQVLVCVIKLKNGRKLEPESKVKLEKWLSKRVKIENVEVIVK